MIEDLAHFMFAPGNRESFANEIKQVAPGEILTFSKEELTSCLSSNAAVSSQSEITDLGVAIDSVEIALINSVQRHLVADVPIALALSGGIDSSLIAEISKTEFHRPLDSFCISFEDDKRSENIQAERIAEEFCQSFSSVRIDPKVVSEEFDSYMNLFGNLSSLDGGIISNALMAQAMAQKGFKVALFGEGADEMFGGYTWFQLNEGFFRALPLIVKKQMYFYAITRDQKFLLGIKSISSKKSFANILEFIQDFEICTQLPQHLLKKVDIATMAASIEGRVPYLDGELFRLQERLHHTLKSSMPKYGFIPDSSRTKPVLRGIYSRRIGSAKKGPPPKKGFQLPLDTLTYLKFDQIQDLINSEDSLSRRVLSPSDFQVVRNLKKDTLRDSDAWKLWRILILEKWNDLVWRN
jgi:asparagine synthase (glutamine-hydrolysing)